MTLLPGLLLLISILWIGLLLRRRRPVTAFGLAVICIALLPSSNFVLPAGIVIAERTLFLSSVGAMLVAGDLLLLAWRRLRPRLAAGLPPAIVGTAACGLLVSAGAVRSGMRSRVWRDNGTLMRQTVRDAPDSYRAHYMLATYYMRERNDKRLAEAEYLAALKLFPYDPYLTFTFAEAYRTSNRCDAAVPLYKWTRQLDPDFPTGRTQYAQCLYEVGDYDAARQMALAAVRAGGVVRLLHELIREIDTAQRASRRIDTGGNASVTALGTPGGKLPDTVQKPVARSVAKGPR
jgi:tetratricopeptide (TPR) repeat protein